MTWRAHGRIERGQVLLDDPLDAPEGLKVLVRIESAEPSAQPNLDVSDFTSLPFFGMWADRVGIQDSAEWVHERRETWGERKDRQD